MERIADFLFKIRIPIDKLKAKIAKNNAKSFLYFAIVN